MEFKIINNDTRKIEYLCKIIGNPLEPTRIEESGESFVEFKEKMEAWFFSIPEGGRSVIEGSIGPGAHLMSAKACNVAHLLNKEAGYEKYTYKESGIPDYSPDLTGVNPDKFMAEDSDTEQDE